LGFLVGGALELSSPIFAEFATRYPGVHLEMREVGFADPAAGLADGSSDVALIRFPVSGSDIDFEPLFVEPLVAGISVNHRLASRRSVSVEELLDEPIVVGRSADEVWEQYWTLNAFRDGKRAPIVARTSSVTEESAIVAAGVGCCVTVAGSARYIPNSGIRYAPIDGIDGSVLAVAWQKGRRTPLVDHFVEVAVDVRNREVDLVSQIERPFSNHLAG
jgi:DNA-binding transcriptional LysR family regulator